MAHPPIPFDQQGLVARIFLIPPHNFYDSIQAPQAELVTEAIERIEPGGVSTSDGKLHELDAIVCATGFHVDAFVRPIAIRGLDGSSPSASQDGTITPITPRSSRRRQSDASGLPLRARVIAKSFALGCDSRRAVASRRSRDGISISS